MHTVGIKALKDKLSEYVRLASAGETILVTQRDRVVAEMGPPRPGRGEHVEDAVLAEAVREGWVRPPVLREQGPPPRIPVAPLGEILRELDEDRADR